jgi:hypothetical protein
MNAALFPDLHDEKTQYSSNPFSKTCIPAGTAESCALPCSAEVIFAFGIREPLGDDCRDTAAAPKAGRQMKTARKEHGRTRD